MNKIISRLLSDYEGKSEAKGWKVGSISGTWIIWRKQSQEDLRKIWEEHFRQREKSKGA